LRSASREGLEVRVAAWLRGAVRPARSAWPLQAWEPVVYSGGRREPSSSPASDAFAYHARPRLTEPERVVGVKPARFAFWLFDLLGARPGDDFADLFPGSGGIGRAWAIYASAPGVHGAPLAGERDPSCQDLADASHVDGGDASRADPGHASREYSGDASRSAAARQVSCGAAGGGS
jgi:hypothetical protein